MLSLRTATDVNAFVHPRLKSFRDGVRRARFTYEAAKVWAETHHHDDAEKRAKSVYGAYKVFSTQRDALGTLWFGRTGGTVTDTTALA